MSSDLKVKQMRAGVQVNPTTWKTMVLQLDLMSQQEASTYGGAAPYVRYNGYVAYFPPTVTVLADDLLVDLVNIDPKTSRNTQYRVVLDAEFFPDNHLEVILDRVRGT